MATWTAAQVQSAGAGPSAVGFANQTVREIVHTSIGGSQLRLRLSDAFDTAAVTVTRATVALRQSGAALQAGTDSTVTVGGLASFVLPAHGVALTDPVDLQVPPEADLAISLYFAAPTGQTTWHPLALTTNYVAAGDQTASLGSTPYSATTDSWYFLTGVDINAPTTTAGIVALGASTTDGLGSTPDTDRRWSDDLHRRISSTGQGQQLSVLNSGISGNRLLIDAGTDGQSGEHRLGPDAVGQPGARYVIVSSLGNNDIGFNQGPDGAPVTVAEMIAGYQQMIGQAHAGGLMILGGTLTPDEGAFYSSSAGEAKRQAINQWILTSGSFDATINFGAAVADPTNPARILSAYDSGDHLHLNDVGYQAMADAVDLSVFTTSGDPIANRYQSLGGPSSFLGEPTGAEQPVGTGRMRTFQGANIYWSPPTGAFEVHGAILAHYLAGGGPAGIAGFPTSDEQPTRGPGGRFNSFGVGVMDWSPPTGAFEVHGAILDRYLALGGTASFLGFPTSDEFQVGPAGRQTNLQNGFINFSFTTGAVTVR
ncbi:MAG: GDSL-type esterase/lipase family protein [Actinomycetota bacterium]|nr:GDSL-type esterase/lipase family protein [Actinomycetota bacterium]